MSYVSLSSRGFFPCFVLTPRCCPVAAALSVSRLLEWCNNPFGLCPHLYLWGPQLLLVSTFCPKVLLPPDLSPRPRGVRLFSPSPRFFSPQGGGGSPGVLPSCTRGCFPLLLVSLGAFYQPLWAIFARPFFPQVGASFPPRYKGVCEPLCFPSDPTSPSGFSALSLGALQGAPLTLCRPSLCSLGSFLSHSPSVSQPRGTKGSARPNPKACLYALWNSSPFRGNAFPPRAARNSSHRPPAQGERFATLAKVRPSFLHRDRAIHPLDLKTDASPGSA